MKIFQINLTNGVGSTGKICVAISELLNKLNVENMILYTHFTNGYAQSYKYSLKLDKKLSALKARVFGNWGFNSNYSTKKLLRKLTKEQPDIIHLHVIHGHDVNVKKLFYYLKKNPQIKVYWTFHDCWAFTAYCSYFDMIECQKWKEGCQKCPQRKSYSWFFDKSKKLYALKKENFTGLNMTIITPSQWLADLTKQSFLKDYPVQVINNGIDLNVFKPTESDFREKYNCADKFVLLGVAFDWGKRKGLDVFIELVKRLDDKYQIVLVGTNENTDKVLPKNIISIHRTQDQKELAEIYTAADLFVNPTREENFPTVNIEALACGTPIVTFNTGGSPEILDKSCGVVVDKDNIDELEKQIRYIYEHKPFAKEDCLQRAREFDMNTKFEEYIKLYGAK